MNRFLSPINGIYKKTATPYKKLFQEMKMTFDIETEGRKYRLVSFYPWFKNGLGPFSVKRYIVVDQEGKIITDEEIVRLCTQTYLLITSMIDSEELIIMDYSDQDKLAEEHKQLLFEIFAHISPHIQGKDPDVTRGYFHKMIEFYSKAQETEIRMEYLAKEAMPLYTSILEDNCIKKHELDQLTQIYLEFSYTTLQRVILILDSARAREVVKFVINNNDYTKFIPSRLKNQYDKLFESFDGAAKAERHALMNNNKHGRRNYEDIIKDLQAEPYDWLTERVYEYMNKRWLNDTKTTH